MNRCFLFLSLSDCLLKIMEAFVHQRSRNAVIKRMVQLGLIADRSEILPSKWKKSKKNRPTTGSESSGNDGSDNGDSSENDSDESDRVDTRPVKVTVKTVASKKSKQKEKQKSIRSVSKVSLNVAEVQRLLSELNGDLKESLEWIQESLNDAADDFEEISEDADDGVPLVPFTGAQRDAFENEQFKAILRALGIQEPVQEMVSFCQLNFKIQSINSIFE